ncbi:MAG: acyl-CoA carboxylase subunit beta [Deltaproteobacteria bacterium]|nr:acyl-CoA carboxylase subunit beta [Deltaproteobacteria bacterium]
MSFEELSKQLKSKKEKVLEMGGAEEVSRQHAAGKLSVRERIDLLFDKGTFIEMGILAHHQSTHPDMQERSTPADGCVTGYGKIEGRLVACVAYDFTVMAGSIGYVQERKVDRLRELALRERIPLVWLLDSAGARIQELAGSQFAESGKLFYDQVKMSGFIPQVAAMMGPCAAGTAYIPALADFVPMVKGTSSMALAGPHLVKAVIGEEVSVEDLGGSKIHCEVSGVGDLEVANDQECIQVIRDYLGFFPQHCGEKPPLKIHSTSDDFSFSEYQEEAPSDQVDASILQVVPENSKRPYDMHEVIRRLVDHEKFLEIKPQFAKNLIVGLGRFCGRPMGIVASQPLVLAGVLDVDSSDKGARFINLCDAFNIPLLFLQDVPGFMVGSKVERQGIIRHGAKMLYAVSLASVPKLTVIVRKAYGAGYYVMCGRGYEPDGIVAWPSAEISLMGAEGAVNILFRKQIKESENPEQTRKELVEKYQKEISLEKAAAGAYIDDIIDPRDTKKWILRTLELAQNKQMHWPKKKHGVMPV